ncbi:MULTISPECIES: UDP-4-amino-4,6-dideoxy-N-acetyl-beta-L-altrosamine transaminase [Gammaproteobacteria]|uniref:UDP-4-amino-4, 6-dideoxy-N-acetyl-beta-L-altrosamine transaminase n=1 Tax=Gammaproteobacteria TaxID=1236 RepID=UPI000DD06A39|nr:MULTISPECIES: UDP-4-amino-4,6-dideoxy-N-acetyl-beta-L-altrosamine transaminase [Gammaproteobacteria]RTE86143.1 UDP-4-amino-4,6-dideoxy-N-acetyl-beta-L-altrosamine transaminase [Aliidiomarina sp. B3213]TCZ91496.1 UDP-4-amino-4,6-dideoxy-N-acetyl-beta-L-altrosamine transaminase [Lysobacter sp. N42]
MIPYGRQDISEEDIAAVEKVLRSDFLTQGPIVPEFEQAIADYCQASFAVAVNSATSALHIACLAAGVGPEDTVWTVPNTFVASANCARYCGAKVDFIDIDQQTGNLSIHALSEKLKRAAQNNNFPKVIIPVHFGGASCDMKAIHELASPHNIQIIEDASHAIGGKYEGHPVGKCEYSEMTVFSFHPVKIITSAEGGMITTNNAAMAKRLTELRSHGITRAPEDLPESAEPWYYEQQSLGFNYRMTELQAALGLSQLQRLDEFVTKRNEIASFYRAQFENTQIGYLKLEEQVYSSYHLFVIQVDKAIRRALFEELRANDIGVNVHYIPVHFQPDFRQFGFNRGDFPNAEHYYDQAITLPLHPNLTHEEQKYVVEQVIKHTENLSS